VVSEILREDSAFVFKGHAVQDDSSSEETVLDFKFSSMM
jgi:hypothetical protein